jgi:hypothetical protein
MRTILADHKAELTCLCLARTFNMTNLIFYLKVTESGCDVCTIGVFLRPQVARFRQTAVIYAAQSII